MKIQLRPRDVGPNVTATLILAFYVFSFGVLSLYFYFNAKNVTYALSSVVIACLGILYFLAFWPLPVPIVIINDEGIFDSRLGVGLIRWEDIIDVQIESRAGFLCLRLRDPDLYISKLKGPARERMKFHQSLGFMMLNIEVRGLDTNLLFLRDVVSNRIKSA